MTFQSLKVAFTLANSADPDEMLHCVAFHLGLHCLPKYLFMFMSFRSTKGKIIKNLSICDVLISS